jgi:phosphogluconate dehydratase
MIGHLLDAGLLHEEVQTVAGRGLAAYAQEPKLTENRLAWEPGPRESQNDKILRTPSDPFAAKGGLKRMQGNLGIGVTKISAVAEELHLVEAPCAVFHSQAEVKAAFKAGKLDRDVVVVLRFQGPKANGMPELHALTPALSVLLGRGHKVALVTDGRMSGASGKVPSAIHVAPEAVDGGLLAKLRDGDVIRYDAASGRLDCLAEGVEARDPVTPDLSENAHGIGRELFEVFRRTAGRADQGAGVVV